MTNDLSETVLPSRSNGAGRDHTTTDAHSRSVGTGATNLNGDHSPLDAQDRDVPVHERQASVSEDADALLLVFAEMLDDIERTRIASENRLRSLRAEFDEPHDAITVTKAIVDDLLKIERSSTKALERVMKDHPLGPWIKRTTGVGLKQGARLLAAIGDPYIRSQIYDEDGAEIEPTRPRRGPAELWAYCGLGDARAQRRQKGAVSNWNVKAKMRAFLVAESCMKATTSPYRSDYDDARAKYADAVHDEPCVRCGPAGHPAPAGSPLSLGHQHARALRKVAKEVLKDMYVEARALHHLLGDAQPEPVQGA